MKKQTRKIRGKGGTKSIRQNRPNFRKKVIGYKPSKHNKYQKPIKIKGKDYEAIKN